MPKKCKKGVQNRWDKQKTNGRLVDLNLALLSNYIKCKRNKP